MAPAEPSITGSSAQDQWAPLAHIPELAQNHRPSSAIAPTWIDDIDARRLTAYRVLTAMRDNTRRYWLPQAMWTREVRGRGDGFSIEDAPAASYREYGDAGLLVDTARALLLGDDQTTGYPDGTTDVLKTWLDAWVVKERVEQKLLEGEENTIGDGDGVYVLGWSTPKQRPCASTTPGSTSPTPTRACPGGRTTSSPRSCTSRGSGSTATGRRGSADRPGAWPPSTRRLRHRRAPRAAAAATCWSAQQGCWGWSR
jgi:hypothetical protein